MKQEECSDYKQRVEGEFLTSEYVPSVGDVVKVIGDEDHEGKSFRAIVFVDEDDDLMLASEKKSKSLDRSWDYAKKYQRFSMKKIGETSILKGKPDVDTAVEAAQKYFSTPTFTGSYQERQAQWIKHHGIKVGSKVKVVRKAVDYEGGYDNQYNGDKDKYLGDTIVISDIHPSYLIAATWCWPYFVLEPVTD